MSQPTTQFNQDAAAAIVAAQQTGNEEMGRIAKDVHTLANDLSTRNRGSAHTAWMNALMEWDAHYVSLQGRLQAIASALVAYSQHSQDASSVNASLNASLFSGGGPVASASGGPVTTNWNRG